MASSMIVLHDGTKRLYAFTHQSPTVMNDKKSSSETAVQASVASSIYFPGNSSVSCFGKPIRRRSRPLFDSMDLNGDGTITDGDFRILYLEVPSLRALPGMGQPATNTLAGNELFESLDKDGNGHVDFDELKAHMKNLRGFQDKAMLKIFNLLDADDDLSLGKEEFRDAYWRYSAFRFALGEQ